MDRPHKKYITPRMVITVFKHIVSAGSLVSKYHHCSNEHFNTIYQVSIVRSMFIQYTNLFS